ncbi:MAG TPA: ROK family protein [Terriglobales bacterium]|nr:ROK family protein [Terriglobales bacterium]
MAKAEPVYLGVDIGGTKVAAGLVSPQGKILSRARVPMPARGDAEAALAAVSAAIQAAGAGARGRSIAAIGLSSPGPLDPRRGVVLNPPNLPCWRNFPLAARIAQAHRLPTRLDNDANAAALAEARWGAGRGFPSVFYATLGTGIGAGWVLAGQVHHGRTGAAVEGGHLSINFRGPRCACGKRGCIEAMAAGPAVARLARLALRRQPRAGRRLLALAEGDPRRITAELVGQAWRDGDPLAAAVLEQTAAALAIWLGNIIDLFEPEIIVFGGGMGALMAEWFPTIAARLPAWTINPRAGEIPLRAARYGAEAGIAGAAALCLP